jgi:non-homologous end joining protein Ku
MQARTGWYKAAAYDLIREMIKTKYVHVRDNNEPAPDSICYDLMQAIEDTVVAGDAANAEQEKEGEGGDEVSLK